MLRCTQGALPGGGLVARWSHSSPAQDCCSPVAPHRRPQPPPPQPATQKTGDAELLRLIRPSFTGKADRVAVAVIEDGEVREAFLRADAATVFEIGSITKVFTGELLAEAIDRGEVRADDPIGDHLDLGEAPIASVTLRDLAAHASGLPTFPTDPEWVEQATAEIAAGRDGVDENARRAARPGAGGGARDRAAFGYSNMGAALVGQALAAAAGTDYRHADRRTPARPARPRRRVGAAR